jgi:hypothetical protein
VRETIDVIPKSKKGLLIRRLSSKMVAEVEQGEGSRLVSPHDDIFEYADSWRRLVVSNGTLWLSLQMQQKRPVVGES